MSRAERLASRAGLVALAIAIVLSLDLFTHQVIGYDLAAYVQAAHRLMAGEALYRTGSVVVGPIDGQFFYPPAVAVLFIPLAVIPFDVARLFMVLLLTALAAWLCWRLVRDLRPGARYWAAAAIAQSYPLVWEIALGNLTLVTLVLCVLAWGWRDRPARSGAAFAASMVLKLLSLPLVAFFVAARRGGTLIWTAVWIGAIVLVTLPVVGTAWIPYAEVIRAIASGPPGSGSNLVPTIFATSVLRGVLPALGIALILLAGWLARSRPATAERAFRLALAAVPLAASTLWYPYLVFALPLLVSSPPAGPAWRWSVLVVARIGCWALMQAQLIREPGRDFLLPLVGLLALLALGCAELALARPSGAPAGPFPDRPRPLATRPGAAL